MAEAPAGGAASRRKVGPRVTILGGGTFLREVRMGSSAVAVGPGHTCESLLRVRYSETDQMGVVYHANYLVWCEIGRTDFIRELGASYAELERGGVRLAVVEATIRYGSPASYDEQVRVLTRLARVRSRTVTFEYEILTEPQRGHRPVRLAAASTRLVALDFGGRPRSLPPELLDRLRAAAVARAP